MSIEKFRDWLHNLRKDYLNLLYGLIIGMVLMVVISATAIPAMLFLQICNILLTGIIMLKIVKPSIKPIQNNPHPNSKALCKECGTLGPRHRKGCSKVKAKNA